MFEFEFVFWSTYHQEDGYYGLLYQFALIIAEI